MRTQTTKKYDQKMNNLNSVNKIDSFERHRCNLNRFEMF